MRGDTQLIEALAAGLAVREAARRAGVSERTAHRRLANPAFRGSVLRARGEMRSAAVGRLADVSTRAAATLETLLGDAYPPAIRLGAAWAVLEHSARLAETVELQERIAALEREKRHAEEHRAAG